MKDKPYDPVLVRRNVKHGLVHSDAAQAFIAAMRHRGRGGIAHFRVSPQTYGETFSAVKMNGSKALAGTRWPSKKRWRRE